MTVQGWAAGAGDGRGAVVGQEGGGGGVGGGGRAPAAAARAPRFCSSTMTGSGRVYLIRGAPREEGRGAFETGENGGFRREEGHSASGDSAGAAQEARVARAAGTVKD